MAATVTAIDARRTSDRLERAMTLPGRVYWDEAILEREYAEIFSTLWVGAGHVAQLANPGDFRRVDFGRESIVLIADSQREIRAFHNTCRHRGTRLVRDECGSGLNRILCPYHAWAYAADGRLVSAPRMEERPGFDKGQFPLAEVRVDTFSGLLMMNLNEDAEALPNALADFPDIGDWGLGGLVPHGVKRYDIAANWKLIVENYSECYHCPLVHPQLHSISDHLAEGYASVEGRWFNGGPMGLREGAATMTMDGQTARAPLPGLNDEQVRLIHYYHIYPNTLVGLHPDYVLVHYVWPRGVDRSEVVTEWYFHPEQVAAPDFDPADAIEFWDVTNQQDWDLCENAQLGLRSSGHQPGPYQPAEECVQMFDRWYARFMGFT